MGRRAHAGAARPPQLENLAQELASEIKPFLEQRPSVIRVHASHGFAVAKLREFLDREPGIGVDLRYVSNQNSLVSLAQGACDLSGLHLPRGTLRAQGIKTAREWLDAREDRVISFVTREMGLMVARGNPLGIGSIDDLTAPKVRFVNRDHDSGTRLLFDQLLAAHGIDESRINGAQQIEFTHAAVAAYVAERHGGCKLRRRGRRPAIRPRLHPGPHRGLFLRLQARVPRHRADAAHPRDHAQCRFSRGCREPARLRPVRILAR